MQYSEQEQQRQGHFLDVSQQTPAAPDAAIYDKASAEPEQDPFLAQAASIENGTGGSLMDNEPASAGGQVSGDQLMQAAIEDDDVDGETAAAMDVGSGDILGDTFSAGNDQKGQQSNPNQNQSNGHVKPGPLDLTNIPKNDPNADSLWNKMSGLFGGKKDDKSMASVSEAVDQYKTEQQNVAAQNGGLDNSMEYRGIPQQSAMSRSGRGGLDQRGGW